MPLGFNVRPQVPFYARAAAILDADRTVPNVSRVRAVPAAESILAASSIGAIQEYSRQSPLRQPDVRVYRVELTPLHVGPVAVLEALEACHLSKRVTERLRREYWSATPPWYLNEVLSEVATIVEEVPVSTEGERYRLRWIQFNEDRDRVAQMMQEMT